MEKHCIPLRLNDFMNRDIAVGFVKEHEEICLHRSLSQELKRRSGCSFCHHVNRDSLLLLTRLPEARKSVDVGLALSPVSRTDPYRPYEAAGFVLFRQKPGPESNSIASVFRDAFSRGYDNAVLIAHGTPNMPPLYVEEAIRTLKKGRGIVLGPMSNGRFYLIGLNAGAFESLQRDGLMGELNFNSPSGKESAIRKLRQNRNDCLLLPQWYALKSLDDLKKLRTDSDGDRAWKARWTTCHVNDILLSEGL
jgi:hypothetical protein